MIADRKANLPCTRLDEQQQTPLPATLEMVEPAQRSTSTINVPPFPAKPYYSKTVKKKNRNKPYEFLNGIDHSAACFIKHRDRANRIDNVAQRRLDKIIVTRYEN